MADDGYVWTKRGAQPGAVHELPIPAAASRCGARTVGLEQLLKAGQVTCGDCVNRRPVKA